MQTSILSVLELVYRAGIAAAAGRHASAEHGLFRCRINNALRGVFIMSIKAFLVNMNIQHPFADNHPYIYARFSLFRICLISLPLLNSGFEAHTAVRDKPVRFSAPAC
jgi:hypothetical protein